MRPTLWASRGIGASFVSDRCVRTSLLILLVGVEQMTKMLLAEDDDVIKALSPDRSDHLSASPFFAEAIELKSGDPVCP